MGSSPFPLHLKPSSSLIICHLFLFNPIHFFSSLLPGHLLSLLTPIHILPSLIPPPSTPRTTSHFRLPQNLYHYILTTSHNPTISPSVISSPTLTAQRYTTTLRHTIPYQNTSTDYFSTLTLHTIVYTSTHHPPHTHILQMHTLTYAHIHTSESLAPIYAHILTQSHAHMHAHLHFGNVIIFTSSPFFCLTTIFQFLTMIDR